MHRPFHDPPGPLISALSDIQALYDLVGLLSADDPVRRERLTAIADAAAARITKIAFDNLRGLSDE